MHSRDKARRSLCMFSSSFFTASGLLVPDMIHQGTSQFLSGANSGTVSYLGRQTAPSRRLRSCRSPPLGLPESGRAWAANPESARATQQTPRSSPALLRGAPRRRPAPPGSAGSGRGAHQAGRSFPLPRGPAKPVVATQLVIFIREIKTTIKDRRAAR